MPAIVLFSTMECNEGWVSPNMEWAAIPYGNKYMLIYKGQQVSVHTTLEIAKKIALKESKKK